MHILGIIAEYNPFHTGHAYQIAEARRLSGADFCVVAISPDFVQRGEPAILDKYTRTQLALQGGADLVVALPVQTATASAEAFATGGVSLLASLGVDTLSFGTETRTDTKAFSLVVSLLLAEPVPYRQDLGAWLREGKSFPEARQRCVLALLGEEAASLLSSPNNILAVEYCKAIKRLRASLTPLPIVRKGSGYGDSTLGGPYCSATALRKALMEGTDPKEFLPYIIGASREDFLAASSHPVSADDLLPILFQKLLYQDSYEGTFEVSKELSDRMLSLRPLLIGKSFEEVCRLLKTRQVTLSHVRRALLHLILGLEKGEASPCPWKGQVGYAQLLGFRREAAPLLHELKHRSHIPLIAKNTQAAAQLDEANLRQFETDVRASHLYRSALCTKTHTPFRTEYECSPVVI